MKAILTDEDSRSDPRSHVFLMAVLTIGAASCAVRVRNLSPHGSLLEGSNLPVAGRTVVLKRGSLAAAGQVAWSRGPHCGIRFAQAIVIAEWVDRAGPVGQQRIDATVAEFHNYVRTGSPLTILPREDDRASLVDLSATLLTSCERLSAMSDMSVELAEELLRIEAAARAIQRLGTAFP